MGVGEKSPEFKGLKPVWGSHLQDPPGLPRCASFLRGKGKAARTLKYDWTRSSLGGEERGARLHAGGWGSLVLGSSLSCSVLEPQLARSRDPQPRQLSPVWVPPTSSSRFPSFPPTNEQRLSPTPAESAREGARHPSGLPPPQLVPRLTHVQLAGFQAGTT